MKPSYALFAALALASCGDSATVPETPNGYTLSGTPPLPSRLAASQSVRSLVLRAETRVGGVATAQRCGYQFALFDVTRASTQTPLASDTNGDCRLYMTPPESEYPAQQWVCAGAITVESGALMQTSGFCPLMGATPTWDADFRGCGGIFTDRAATVSSGDEIGPEDHVTDLTGTVRFPTSVLVTQPTTFSVTTWPATGDLVVTWTSSDATSAVVRIEPDTATRTGPTIVCSPRVNGTMRVEAALIDRGGFRASQSRLTVWSYRESTTQAEGHTWKLAGAMGTSIQLQPAR
ncbi:MAG: hypothetical protein U0326_26995 [Polyangiales bacterium]